jgi:hypothetical protein
MSSRITLLFAFLLPAVFAAAAGAQEPPARFDHYDPVSLNEMAMQKVREGDTGTAVLLLERAVLLAPHEGAIRRNLDLLKAWRDGKPLPEDASVAPAAANTSPADTGDAQLPPFPLWPKGAAE